MKAIFTFFLSITLFGVSNIGVSQNINIGALAGINASQVSGDGYAGFNKAGLLLGLYSNFDISQKLNFQFEINYSERGSRRNPKTDEGDTDFFLLRMSYIDIPAIIRFKSDRFVFELGAYYGQLIKDYLEDENGPFEIDPAYNQFKNYDVGALVGINFHFTESIIMNWRYSNSIVPFRKYDSGANYWFNSGMYHSFLSFTLRYEFIGDGS